MWKTKLMAVALLTATLSIGIGTRALSTADAQGFDPRTGPPAGGADPAPKTSPRPAAPTPGTGMNMPGMGGMPGMSGMAASAGRNPRVEYRFLARPESADAFKKLLTQQGTDGWEYAGSVPGDGELIFKRTQALSGGFFGGGMMPGGGAADMTPFGGGFGSRSGGGAGGFGVPSSPGGPLTPGANDGGKTTGGLPARFGGSTLPANPTLPSATSTDSGVTSKMSLRVGETIRHLMKSKQAVDRVHSDNTRSVEVSLDPTDAKRVLIRGLNTDGARIELTDANGNKERYIVEVR